MFRRMSSESDTESEFEDSTSESESSALSEVESESDFERDKEIVAKGTPVACQKQKYENDWVSVPPTQNSIQEFTFKPEVTPANELSEKMSFLCFMSLGIISK